MLKSREDAFNLLERLGAPRRLFIHLELVGEVGGEFISKLDDLGFSTINASFKSALRYMMRVKSFIRTSLKEVVTCMKQQAKSYFLNREFAPKLLGAAAATHNTPA